MKGKWGGEHRIKLEGTRIGYWDVGEYVKERKAYWVTCVCGKKKMISARFLRSGDTRSCGCKAYEVRRENKAKRKARFIVPDKVE